MGEVYRARDPRLGRDVAIKVLPAGVGSDPDRLGRFEQEARATAALNHPNIVAVHDVGKADGVTFVVSELLEGETLRQALVHGAIPARQAVEYAVQIAHGLAAAHEKGIIHRDLKPENVFVTRDGRVKILDFGLAKLTEAEPLGGTMLTTTPVGTAVGLIVGTIGYMSPEQVRGVPVDHRADIFAFGAILYELFTGEPAFRRQTKADTIIAILKEDPPQLADPVKMGGAALQRVVQRCLDKRPELRFHSAHDLAYAIEAAATHTSSGAVVQTSSGTIVRPTMAAVTRARRLRIAAALAIVLGVVAGAYVTWGRLAKRDFRLTRFVVALPPGARLSASNFGVAEFSVSPDGQHIAVNLQTADGIRTWVRRIDDFEMRPIAGTEGVSGFPFWSPDSRSLGFVASGKLKRVAIDGGAVQTIGEMPGAAFTAAWGPDGTILAGGTKRTIRRIPASGGELQPVTKLAEGEQMHLYPAFLPDGRRFLYTAVSNRSGIYLASLDGGEPRRVLDDVPGATLVGEYLVYPRERAVLAQRVDLSTLRLIGDPTTIADDVRVLRLPAHRILHSVAQAGTTLVYQSGREEGRLVWVDRSGRDLGQVGEPGNISTLALSRSGTRVAFGIEDPRTGVMHLTVTDLSRGVTTRVTTAPVSDSGPAWSPNDDQIAFHSVREDGKQLYVVGTMGGEPKPLLQAPNGPSLNIDDWSRDGRYVLYHETDTRQMLALELGGERRKILVVRGSTSSVMTALATPDEGTFSPDGAFVAFNVGTTGRSEVFVKRFPPTDEQWQISNAGGMQPRWRADGKELFYLAPDASIMAVDVSLRPGGLIATPPRRLFRTRLSPSTGTDQYAVTNDGQRFLIIEPVVEEQSLPLRVIVDWPALVGRR